MSKKPLSTCPVCSEAFNDNTKLPLATPCHHTHCLACLRDLTLALHPDVEASRAGQLPSGKKIECPKCQKRVNTDDFVIDRAALATVPLSLEDLIIADDSLPKTKPSKSGATTTKAKTKADPTRPLGNTTHSDLGPGGKTPQGVEYGLGGDTDSPYDTTPGQEPLRDPACDLVVGTSAQTSAKVISGVSQGPIGWTRPTSPPLDTSAMDPHHPHHHHPHPQGQGQGVGWAVPPGYVPPPTGPYTQMPLPPGHHHHPHDHNHHPHGHTVAAGAAGVAAGVAAGAGVTALAVHKKKKKGKKGKKEKKHKEGRHRSSSSSSSGSSRSSSSSRSSKSSNSS